MVDSYDITGNEEIDNYHLRDILMETGETNKIYAILLVFKATDYNDSNSDRSMANLLSKILISCQAVKVFVIMTHCDIMKQDPYPLALQKAKSIEERCNIKIPLENIIKFNNTSESLKSVINLIESSNTMEFIETKLPSSAVCYELSCLMGPPAYRKILQEMIANHDEVIRTTHKLSELVSKQLENVRPEVEGVIHCPIM
jgi:hypothetical protein